MARETETLFRLVMNDHEFLCHDDVHNIEKRRTYTANIYSEIKVKTRVKTVKLNYSG